MVGETTALASSDPAEIRAMLRQLQDETILWVLPALYLVSLILFAAAAHLREPSRAILPCVAAFLLGVAVWAVRKLSYLASAWLLVLASAAVVLLIAHGMATPAAICLLALPAGLAALFVSIPGSLLVAAASSLLLLYAPPSFLAAASELRMVALIEVWGSVGLIWLTRRPLLTTVQWSWSSYRENRGLLEQARDQRLQLKQALADLADANLQLTRLNRLAQALHRAAEDARRAKEQFVANVSHELRTPLNMVIGFSETILQAPETYGKIPPALLADLAVILRNSRHLASLIDDVLDLSQIEAGQMALTRERVAICEVIEAATVAVRPLFTSKGLSLEMEVADGLPLVFCDRTRIREVLLNLLSNAGRFTERGGVRVQARQVAGEVEVSVADTGPGIAAADRERLFRPFEQLDGSLRRRYGGTGLGLSISRSFVELHGGRMWLDSEVGRGTTFYFRLPIDPPGPAEGSVTRWLLPSWEYEQHTRRPSVAPPSVRPRLVVLESGHSLQRLLARYLGEAEIVAAATLPGALDELVRMPAQALLINHPSVADGLRQLDETSGLPYGTPAIVCSMPGTHEAAGALGVADYLLKPISREALLATLGRLQVAARKVLVVDDDPDAARLFRRILSSDRNGRRVLTAGDGCEALAILRQERPDAVLLDLLMPNMDGYRFLSEKSKDPAVRDIPVVVISASDPTAGPIVTKALAITQGGGLAVPQLLACLEAVSGSCSPSGRSPDPGPLAAPHG